MEQAADVAQLRSLLPAAIGKLPPEVRFRAQNALAGFSRAKSLLKIDREIASFRAITAAEEAASALIRSLQIRAYPNAYLIDLKRHTHKAAVPIFIAAVRNTMAANVELTVTVNLTVDPPALKIGLPMWQFGVFPEGIANAHIELVDPLGMVGSMPGVLEDNYFDAAVNKVAGSRKVDKMIVSEANARNTILYGHDGGLPRSRAVLKDIEQREHSAELCLFLAIAVMQVEHHQAMALQCLAGFLKVIGRAPTS